MELMDDNQGGVVARVPAIIRVQDAAVAILMDRLREMDRETKNDLLDVILSIRDCSTDEEFAEIERTIIELLQPERADRVRYGSMPVDKEASQRIAKRAEWIGSKIKELRNKKGWTQERLASACGIPQSHVSRLEKGRHSPSHQTLERLAKSLGVKIGDIDPAH